MWTGNPLAQLGNTEHILEHHLNVTELRVRTIVPDVLRAREGVHQRTAIEGTDATAMGVGDWQ